MDLQGELIDLLGVELFELAGDILEKRNKIVFEVKSQELAKVEHARQAKAKVIVLKILKICSKWQNITVKKFIKIF